MAGYTADMARCQHSYIYMLRPNQEEDKKKPGESCPHDYIIKIF